MENSAAGNQGGKMRIKKFLAFIMFALVVMPCGAESLFFEDEPIQDGLNVFDVSATFADIYEKLDSVKWGGKNINVAIESLEKLNPDAHIAATDERVVLVWKDSIIANYPRPQPNDWNGFGEITTALVLKLRANDPGLHSASESEMYQLVVDSLMRGIDENGRYIYSRLAEVTEDGRILTSVGLEGMRDARGNWRITGVYKDSPADISGLREGDLIVAINGVNVGKTPLSVESETNEQGCFIRQTTITAIPQEAKLHTQVKSFPAYNPSNPDLSLVPEKIIFNMFKNPSEENCVEVER